MKYLIKKIIKDPKLFNYIDWFELCKNPALIKIIKKMILTHPQYINWYGLSENSNAINIIKKEFVLTRFKNIKWENLKENINAFDIIKYILYNYPHIEFKSDCNNINYIKLFSYDHNTNWSYLSYKEYYIDILEESYKTNPEFIDWNSLNENPKKHNLLRTELINSKLDNRRCLIYKNIIYENECLFDLLNFDKINLTKYNWLSLCKNPKAINMVLNKIELDKINNKKCDIKYSDLLKYPHVFKINKKIYKNNTYKFY